MSEQIKSGDVVRFENTDNRYKIKLMPNGIWLRPLQSDGTAGNGFGVEDMTFERMLRDGVITREGNDGSA